jgi:hypothetical protein
MRRERTLEGRGIEANDDRSANEGDWYFAIAEGHERIVRVIVFVDDANGEAMAGS